MKTPPAVMINTIIAMPDIASLTHFIVVCIDSPILKPKYHIASITANRRAIVGSPMNPIIFLIKLSSVRKIFETTADVISNTGSNPITKLENTPGNFFPFPDSSAKKNELISTLIFCSILPSTGPASITTGTAMMPP